MKDTKIRTQDKLNSHTLPVHVQKIQPDTSSNSIRPIMSKDEILRFLLINLLHPP